MEISFFSSHGIFEAFSTKSHGTVKDKLQKNGLLRGKSKELLLLFQVQKYKFVDFTSICQILMNTQPTIRSCWIRLALKSDNLSRRICVLKGYLNISLELTQSAQQK